MKLPIAIARGISASVAPGPLVALGWMYGLLAALALAFTVFVYLLIASGVANSAVGSQLRKGISADWLVDTLTQPGAGSKFMSVLFLAVALALVYAVASVALSGGVVSRIVDRVGSGRAVNDPFVAECGRYAGPMLRVAIVEFLFLGLTGGALVIVWVVGMIGNAGNAFAWTSVTVIAVVLSAIAATADVARVHVVATGDRSAIAAWRDAISHAVRRAPSFVLLVLFNLVVALVVAWIAVTIHSTISRETGSGVILGLVVGQIGIIGRIWARIAALASQASLRIVSG